MQITVFKPFAIKHSQVELTVITWVLFKYSRSGNCVTFDSFAFVVAFEYNIENDQIFSCDLIPDVYKYWSFNHHGQL